MEKLLCPSYQNNYGLAKLIEFSIIQGSIQYWMKNVHFHFTKFPSKDVIITNYSHICDFIWLYQHCSCVGGYNSHIYECTHL
jgi:hypothetical protein